MSPLSKVVSCFKCGADCVKDTCGRGDISWVTVPHRNRFVYPVGTDEDGRRLGELTDLDREALLGNLKALDSQNRARSISNTIIVVGGAVSTLHVADLGAPESHEHGREPPQFLGAQDVCFFNAYLTNDELYQLAVGLLRIQGPSVKPGWLHNRVSLSIKMEHSDRATIASIAQNLILYDGLGLKVLAADWVFAFCWTGDRLTYTRDRLTHEWLTQHLDREEPYAVYCLRRWVLDRNHGEPIPRQTITAWASYYGCQVGDSAIGNIARVYQFRYKANGIISSIGNRVPMFDGSARADEFLAEVMRNRRGHLNPYKMDCRRKITGCNSTYHASDGRIIKPSTCDSSASSTDSSINDMPWYRRPRGSEWPFEGRGTEPVPFRACADDYDGRLRIPAVQPIPEQETWDDGLTDRSELSGTVPVPVSRPNLSTAAAPEILPIPASERTPKPVPERVPRPVPERVPSLVPDPETRPAPARVPKPVPKHLPRPVPERVQKPVPDRVPKLAPERVPKPAPEHRPKPTPERLPPPVPVALPTPVKVRVPEKPDVDLAPKISHEAAPTVSRQPDQSLSNDENADPGSKPARGRNQAQISLLLVASAPEQVPARRPANVNVGVKGRASLEEKGQSRPASPIHEGRREARSQVHFVGSDPSISSANTGSQALQDDISRPQQGTTPTEQTSDMVTSRRASHPSAAAKKLILASLRYRRPDHWPSNSLTWGLDAVPGMLPGSSPRWSNIRGTGPRGGSPRGGSPRRGSPVGGSPRGCSPRGTSPKGSGPRGGSPKRGNVKGSSPKHRGSSHRGDHPKGSSARGDHPKGNSPKGSSARGSSPKGANPKSGNPKDSSHEMTSRGRAPKRGGRYGSYPHGASPPSSDPHDPSLEVGPVSGGGRKKMGRYTVDELRREHEMRIRVEQLSAERDGY